MTSSEKREALAREIVFASADCSVASLLERVGVTESEYAALLCDGEFMARLGELSAHAAEAESARVLRSLGELSKSGDVKIVRLYFDLLDETRSKNGDDGGDVTTLCREIWG